MTKNRPDFVPQDAEWRPVFMRFNGVQIYLNRTAADPRHIKGWTDNPRVEMVIKRWRNRHHMSADAVPDDEQMLDLMLEDDERNKRKKTFAIVDLGEDVKLNGVREPIIVTWDGKLLDGNRRKFAVMWALSNRGGASHEHLKLLSRIPMSVLGKDATPEEEQSILIQENYAESLKLQWPEVVTNGALYRRYQELSDYFPNENDLEIRQRLQEEFPRFNVTDIKGRIDTWNLIEEFRVEYCDDVDEDDLESLINERFQFFRQANDTFRKRNVFNDPEFKELLFKGISLGLFPSFASVRELDDIYQSERATEVFLQGDGMTRGQKRDNFKKVRDEAGRERANRDLTLAKRLEETIEFLNDITSIQLSEISPDLRDQLENALQRIVAQAAVFSTDASP